jgi:hypothetical protein
MQMADLLTGDSSGRFLAMNTAVLAGLTIEITSARHP